MNINSFKRLAFIFALGLLSITSYGQDADDFLQGEYLKDSEKLIGAYLAPLMKSTSVGLNSGWYNTAKPHKLIGIDLTMTVSALAIPNSQTSFNVDKLGLTNIELDPAASSRRLPTVLGKDFDGAEAPDLIVRDDMGNEIDRFDAPSGLNLKDEIGKNIIPLPMAHIGIGLPKGTDLKIRFVPTLDFDDGEFKMFGLGVMHDVKQWIPGLKLLPFDLSGFVGYTRMSMKLEHENEINGQPVSAYSQLTMNATTVQGVISKKVSVLTVYGGLGYNIAKSSLDVKGRFDLDEDGVSDVKDPISLKYGASGPRVTAGFRLKLAVLTLHADYTLQKYSALSVGLGISVR
jgi:hypothetical protein